MKQEKTELRGAKRSERAGSQPAEIRSDRAAAARKRKKRAKPTPRLQLVSQPAGSGDVPEADYIAQLIDTWKPGRGLDEIAEVWEAIAPSVRKNLTGFKCADKKRATQCIIALARHTAAQYKAGHLIDDPAQLFTDAALVQTYGEGIAGSVAKESLRKELVTLRKIRITLLPDVYAPRIELKNSRRVAPLRFTEKELSQLFAYARQRSNRKSKNFHAALLICLGAGLTGVEVSNARGSDLIASPWGLFIETAGLSSGGNRGPRVVPILAKYEDELSKLAKEFGDDLFIGLSSKGKVRQPNKVVRYGSNLPVFETGRARSNWARTLLENQVSFISLRQAGVAVKTEGFLHELGKDLEPDFESYVTSIRGGATPFNQANHQHLRQYAVGQ